MTPEQLKRMVFPGESGGDYNALFGYANRPGGQFEGFNLTDMTVDQALQFAAPSGAYGQSVRNQIGRVATPMGAFQVVGTTLADAKQGLGLTGSERMTPELQDQIGMWIYENQGPGAWEAWGKSGGGSGSRSSGSGTMPMGLFDMQEEPQTFGQRLREGVRSGGLVDALALAANSLRMNPDPNIATMVQARQERRGEERTNNRTAQWLMTQNRADLAQALMTGALDAKTAVATALQKPNAVNGVEVGGKLVNPETGEIMYDPTGGAAAPVLDKDQLAALNTLRDDMRAELGPFEIVKQGYNNITAVYNNPGSTSDYALAVAFAKILDPGSVAREGEVAAVQNAGARIPALGQALTNAITGEGQLTAQVRQEIAELATKIYSERATSAQRTLEGYSTLARQAGIPEQVSLYAGVIPEVQQVIPAVVPQSAAAQGVTQEDWTAMTQDERRAFMGN
jgi:hypothetical protein